MGWEIMVHVDDANALFMEGGDLTFRGWKESVTKSIFPGLR